MHGHKGRGICHVAIQVAISGSELRRMTIPRTTVNVGQKKRKDQGSQEPRPYVL